MELQRVYLDSNIIISAFEAPPSDDLARDFVATVTETVGTAKRGFLTSQLTLAETLVIPVRRGDHRSQSLYRRMFSLSSLGLEVMAIDTAVLTLAAEIRAFARLKLPDAIHYASAQLGQCSHFMTGDADFIKPAVRETGGPEIITLNRQTMKELAAWLES